MKKIFSLIIFSVLFAGNLSAQVGISPSTNPLTPDLSSILDVNFTNKGLLIPQYNLLDVTSTNTPVLNPTDGLVIYNTGNTTNVKGLYMWIKNRWQSTTAGGTESQSLVLRIDNPDPQTYTRVLIPANNVNNILTGFNITSNNITGASLGADKQSITLPAGTYIVRYGVDGTIDPTTVTTTQTNVQYFGYYAVAIKSYLVNSTNAASLTEINYETNLSNVFASFFGTFFITFTVPTTIKQRFEFDNTGGNSMHQQNLAIRTNYVLNITKMAP